MFDEQKQIFPCPICGKPLEIRQTKKDKPYVVCDHCQIQMFVRGKAGITEFKRLADRAEKENVWERLGSLEKRFRLVCQECKHSFWIEKDLVKTSWVDGSFLGFRCPQENCGATVEWE